MHTSHMESSVFGAQDVTSKCCFRCLMAHETQVSLQMTQVSACAHKSGWVTKHCKMTGLGMRSAAATLQFIWCALAIANVKHGKATVHFVLPKHSQGGNCLGVNKTGKMSVNVFGVMHGFRLLCTPLCMFVLQKCMQLVQRMSKCLLRCCLALSCGP